MAIDLNKSHYNSDGQKMRVVYPEKEVPEIYPQRAVYPKKDNSEEIYPQREIYPQKKISLNDNFGEIYPQTKPNMPVKAPIGEQNVGKKTSALRIGGAVALIVGAVCTIFGMILNESGKSHDPDLSYKTTALFYTGDAPADSVKTIIIELDKTDITLCADDENYSGNIEWELLFENGVSPMWDASDGVLNIYADTSEEKNMLEENRKAEISLPYDFAGDITIKSKNGKVSVSDLNKGNLTVESVGSDVEIAGSEFSLADIDLESSTGNNTVDIEYCAGDDLEIRSIGANCRFDFCAAKTLTLHTDKRTSITNAFISEETDINAYEGFIQDNVFNGYTSIGISQAASVEYCEFNGSTFIDSLNKDVSLDAVSVEEAYLRAERGNINARLCDSKDKFTIVNDDGTLIFPQSEGSGKYTLTMETDGGDIDITYDYSDSRTETNTDEAVKFAERYGFSREISENTEQ